MDATHKTCSMPKGEAAEERRRQGLAAAIEDLGHGPNEAAAMARAAETRLEWPLMDTVREALAAPTEKERQEIYALYNLVQEITEEWIEEGRAADAAVAHRKP